MISDARLDVMELNARGYGFGDHEREDNDAELWRANCRLQAVIEDELLPPDGYINADGRYVTGVGQVLAHIHESTPQCVSRGCPIHHPSNHSMREFPTLWRGDRGLMERICPHGVGHPDPDHLAFVVETYGLDAADTESVHGCDGCCVPGRYEEMNGVEPGYIEDTHPLKDMLTPEALNRIVAAEERLIFGV